MSVIPGQLPPIFWMTKWSALPRVALAFHPRPRALVPKLISSCLEIGPLTISIGTSGLVVVAIPLRLNSGFVTASTAAINTGMYSEGNPPSRRDRNLFYGPQSAHGVDLRDDKIGRKIGSASIPNPFRRRGTIGKPSVHPR